ncbi:hypothetical protein T484DRAFT_1846417 [Baffinella frigidus]|nr:hypothetical protein T484DRAFT_1846417 [Cryptophyta sp. CCMP2293]
MPSSVVVGRIVTEGRSLSEGRIVMDEGRIVMDEGRIVMDEGWADISEGRI